MVERCFNKLKNSRRLTTRYDKIADSFVGFVDVDRISLWLRHFQHDQHHFGTSMPPGVSHHQCPSGL